MRRLLLIGLLVFIAALSIHGQTATATASWTSNNPLADSQTFVYSLKDGAAAAVPISPVTCSQTGATVTCQGTIATPTPGAHSWVLLVTSADGSLQAASAPKLGTMPGAPNGILIKVVVTIP